MSEPIFYGIGRNGGYGRRPIDAYGLAFGVQSSGFSDISFQARRGRFQSGKRSFDAVNVVLRMRDGFRGLVEQIGDAIRFRQVGTFIAFESVI